MDFNSHWIKLVMACVTTIEYCILNDKGEMGPITPKRGLQIGDPLSPYLFILALEGLSAKIKCEQGRGNINDFSICRGAPIITHLLFANDLFIFLKANEQEALAYKNILADFEKTFGQIINHEKSSISYSRNVLEATKSKVESFITVRRGDYSGNYLGLPSLVVRYKRHILGFIKG